jgi:hypothetical protein
MIGTGKAAGFRFYGRNTLDAAPSPSTRLRLHWESVNGVLMGIKSFMAGGIHNA